MNIFRLFYVFVVMMAMNINIIAMEKEAKAIVQTEKKLSLEQNKMKGRIAYEADVIRKVGDFLRCIEYENNKSISLEKKHDEQEQSLLIKQTVDTTICNVLKHCVAMTLSINMYPVLFDDSEYAMSFALKIMQETIDNQDKDDYAEIGRGRTFVKGLVEGIERYFDEKEHAVRTRLYQQLSQTQLFDLKEEEKIKNVVSKTRKMLNLKRGREEIDVFDVLLEQAWLAAEKED